MNQSTGAERVHIEAALRDLRPFTEIASRYGISYTDIAVVHHLMDPRPLQWPEAVPLADAEAAEAAIARIEAVADSAPPRR